MRYLIRAFPIFLTLLMLVFGTVGLSVNTESISADNRSEVLLNFYDDEEECTWSWRTGEYGAWTGYATAESGALNAELSPSMSKIGFHGGSITHLIDENDIIEIAFTTNVVRGGSLSAVNGFSVDCCAGSSVVEFTNQTVSYASAGQQQTIRLYRTNGSELVRMADFAQGYTLTIHPYLDTSGTNREISATITIDYIYIGSADLAPSGLSVPNGDLFFDFTNNIHDRIRYSLPGYNRVQFDEKVSYWKGFNAVLTMDNGADCASDGRMMANGTLKLYATSKNADDLSLQTGSRGLEYTGNKDDVYAEVRVKAAGFDASRSGKLCIYPCNKDGSVYSHEDGSAICLTATYSPTDLTADDYVTLRFTNASQFVRWQSLESISHITVVFRYDDLETSHSLLYDYIYIGSERPTHVMMDFTADSPANTPAHWTAAYSGEKCHNINGVNARSGCLYGTIALNDSLATHDQLRYTVQAGDIVKIRVKLSCNHAKGDALEGLQIGMGVGGKGYRPEYKGTILNIPSEKLQIDGVYHEYTIKVPNDAGIVGNPLRSFCFGFYGQDGAVVDFEIDYIYVGSEINFSAYTGRSTTVEVSAPAEDDLQTIDNSLIDLRLFSYNQRVNDNVPEGLPYGLVLESCFPFRDEHTGKDGKVRYMDGTSHWNRFYEENGSTVMPYLSPAGFPTVNLSRNYNGLDSASLACLFGSPEAVGVHAYTPVNTFLTFDGETYSYDSTKHGVDYATATDQFYVHGTADGGFTPFGESDWFGFSMEMNFVQASSDAVLELSCIDDAWVFIDGALVLDLGGGDVCKVGSINFKTGKITASAGDKSQTFDILQRYREAGRQAITHWNGNTFAEGSVHTLKIFFLNRSTKGTQCKLAFNLGLVDKTAQHTFEGDLVYKQVVNDDLYPLNLYDADTARKPLLITDSYARRFRNAEKGRMVVRRKDSSNKSQNYVYATEDENLRLYYDVIINDHTYQMGDIAKYSITAPILAIIELYDPDADPIGTVDLIGSDGKIFYSETIADSYAYLEIPLTGEQSYYYVRVIGTDRNQTISAPVWLELCENHESVTDMAVAPNCTTEGMTAGSHCSACFAIIRAQEPIPAIGHSYGYSDNDAVHTSICENCKETTVEPHSYTDGICICGAVEAPTPALVENIHIHHTLNLENSIALNYVVPASELKNYDSFYLECIIPEFEGNVQIGESVVEIQPVLKGNYYYFVLDGLSAVRMNDRVEAIVRMMKDTLPYCSAVDRFSIADYAYSILNNTAMEDALKTLCADLLRYGAEAQAFKGYRTNAPADAKMTAAHRAYLTNSDTISFDETDQLLGDVIEPSITWVGKTLSLDSKVGIKFVFDAKGHSPEGLTVKVRYQDNAGVEKTIVLANPTIYNASAGYYAVTFYDLTAAELRTVITVAVYDGEGQVSESLQYGSESYAAKTEGTSLEPLCKALFAYSDSAKAYFAKGS